jgi:integrase/recombinase XerD
MRPEELHLRIDAYLAARQAMGFALRAERTLLHDFARFLEAQGNVSPIRAQSALDWACQSSSQRGVSGQAARLTMARQFLLHLRATDPETEVPEYHLLAAGRRPKPYLFSDEEIAAILKEARQAGPAGSLRPHTLATFIGLLASTGVRVGEALRLKIFEVQLAVGSPHLLIRETKFHKSRLVPVHPTTAQMLKDYTQQRARLHYDCLSDAFLISEQGAHLPLGATEVWFARLVRRLGLQSAQGQRRPCLQCFRHTFAVRRIEAWYEQGVDVPRMLPHLSVYLGHVRPQESYWYLTATPELLTGAAQKFEAYAATGGKR